MTKPLNEHLLWKGAIQRANYPKPVLKPNMILPEINTLTGRVMNQENINDLSYAIISKNYWDRTNLKIARIRAKRLEKLLTCTESSTQYIPPWHTF